MRSVRRLAMAVAFLTWVYCWELLHGASRYLAGFGGVPGWLGAAVGLAILSTAATVVIGAMRVPLWPWLAVAGALLVVVAAIGVQFAELHATAVALRHLALPARSVTLGRALHNEFQLGAGDLIFFIVAPVMLVATGIMGWRFGPHQMFLPEGGTPEVQGA